MFDWFKEDNNRKSRELQIQPDDEEPKIDVLMEIVSGINIRFNNRSVDKSSSIDPYCVVKLSSSSSSSSKKSVTTVVHKTHSISNNTNPVWTIKTNSLCILSIPENTANRSNSESDDDSYDVIDKHDKETITDKKTDEQKVVATTEPEQKDKKKRKSEITGGGYVNIEVCHGLSCIGIVNLSYESVLKSNGERIEYPIYLRDKSSSDNDDDNDQEEKENLGMLALRFRRATDDDVAFVQARKANSGSPTSLLKSSTDINFKKVQAGPLPIASNKRIDRNDGLTKYRVQPYPDPKKPSDSSEAIWLTKDEIHEESLKPSSKWSETGYGDVGTVYLEIISCKNLPNLDSSGGLGTVVGDKTDPFVSIVYEDNMVRTDIIQNTLNPRWMPWSNRAYAFNMVHSSSLIFLGVFDYDGEPLSCHEPIGRVVINTTNFQCDTSYLLTYKLYKDAIEQESAGEITIRLRLSWGKKGQGYAKSLLLKSNPPRFLINVDNEKAFKVLRYVCRGPVNMVKPSMASIKLYGNELASHIKDYGYVLDVIFGVLLWRGRLHFTLLGKPVSIWFPVQSIVLFASTILAIEYPLNTLGILLLYCSWVMYSINYHASTKPNPWNRVNFAGNDDMIMLTGKTFGGNISIKPNYGVAESNALRIVDKYKTDRVSTFLWDLKTVGLKARRIYAQSKVTSYSIETEDTSGWSLLNDKFYYPHLLLFYLVTYTRMFRNLIMWRSTSTHVHVFHMTIAGILFVLFPINTVLQWLARITAFAILGPWMKLVDIFVVRPLFDYKTTEEILESIQSDEAKKNEVESENASMTTNLESWLNSDTIRSLTQKKRFAAEDAIKLKDMRDYRYGKFCETVPQVDTSRYSSVPTFDSTAQPYLGTATTKRGNSQDDESKLDGYIDTPAEEQSWLQIEGQKLEGTMIHTPLNTTTSAVRGPPENRD